MRAGCASASSKCMLSRVYALGCLGCALSCVFRPTRFHSRMKTAMPLSPALALMRLSAGPASGASGSKPARAGAGA